MYLDGAHELTETIRNPATGALYCPVISFLTAATRDDGQGHQVLSFGGGQDIIVMNWDQTVTALNGSKVKIYYTVDSGEEWHLLVEHQDFNAGTDVDWISWPEGFNTETEGFYLCIISESDPLIETVSPGYQTKRYS